MRTRGQTPKAVAAVLASLLLAALAIVPAALGAPGGAAVPGSEPAPSADAGYVNPFGTGSWTVSRTDMGVDYVPNHREPVLAIGRAEILGASMKSGWPGGAFLYYRLLDGDHAGDVIYVAEHLRKLLPAGSVVEAGQRIATALPGYPWTEWGWAEANGNPRAYPCYRDGVATNSGREMARFLEALGATQLRRLKPGPDWPAGRRC